MKIRGFFGFLAGTIVGSGSSIILMRKRYEVIAQEEINSVKESYNQKIKVLEDELLEKRKDVKTVNVTKNKTKKATPKKKITADKSTLDDYDNLSKNLGYKTDYNTQNGLQNETVVNDLVINDTLCVPRVISEDEHTNSDSYDDYVELTYFADGVLIDDRDNVIKNTTELLGSAALSEFDDKEVNVVYVRNDGMRIDYEILRDIRTYSEVVGDAVTFSSDMED